MYCDISRSWFALRVRTRSEVLVGSLLRSKGYEAFSPTYIEHREYSDRTKNVSAALLPGYVFCRFQPPDILPIVNTPAVLGIVTIGSRPASISDSEIEQLRRAADSGKAQPHQYLHAGQKMRVRFGPLAGTEGLLVAVKGVSRLVILTELLQRAVSVEIDMDQVVPVLPVLRNESRYEISAAHG